MLDLPAIVVDQDGLLTRAQAQAAGLTDAQLRYRVRPNGRWQRVVPGVYATFTGPLTPDHRLRAALLHGGVDAQLTGLSALRLLELRYLPTDNGVAHILVHLRHRPRSTQFVRVHRTGRLPTPWWSRGLPCTPAARAGIDACRTMPDLRAVRALLCELVQRGRTSVDRLLEELACGHSAGSALPRLAMADIAAGCRSAPECEARNLVLSSRLPDPLWNKPLVIGWGQKYVPDAQWPEVRLILEINSAEYHVFGDAPELTERRRSALVAAGWTVLGVSPRRLREQRETVLRELEITYLRLAARRG